MGVDPAGDLEPPLRERLHQCRSEGHGGHLQGHLSVFHDHQRVLLKLDGVDLRRGAHTDQVPGYILIALTQSQTCKTAHNCPVNQQL